MSDVDLLDDLEARGLIHDSTDRGALRERLLAGPVTVYCGFDPTGDSLHVGHLLPLLLLRRFQLAGHRPIALAGGATGMIGDPSGRSEERSLLDDDTLAANVEAISTQLARLLDFDAGPRSAVLVDNRTWTAPMSALEFLRDVGKHVTVNTMLAKESVRARVESEHGISFTEFSYMLLQANDYWWLHDQHGCEVQVGGSDQWGNITAGIDLIRRRSGATVHGLTVPLVLRADGTKFGKSAGKAIWLDPERTSPYELYQYFVQTDDRDVERFLAQFTFLALDEVASVMAQHRLAPQERSAQRALAWEVTGLIHGEDAATAARSASSGFTVPVGQRSDEELAALADEIPTSHLERSSLEGLTLVTLLAETPLASSRSDARRSIEGGGIYLNDERQHDDVAVAGHLLHGRYLVLRKGKKRRHLVVVEG